jgi:hypothetical protein
LINGGFILSICMRSPFNQHTDKTKKRLEKDSKPVSVGMDFTSLVQSILSDPEIQQNLEIVQESSIEATKRIDTKESVRVLKNILSEYFDSFMIMGYDVNGERTVVRSTKNDKDDDAAIELLRFVLLRMINKGN